MPHPWNSRSRIAMLAALALGCSPGEPLDLPTTVGPIDIALRDSTGELELPPGQESRSHHLTLADDSEIAIFVQGIDGALRLQALVGGADLGVSADLYPADPVLLASRTDRFLLTAGRTLNVVVSREGAETASSLRYRLFVYPVNRDPEQGTGTVVLDQVRNEDLDTSADIDEYALVDQEGEDLIGYLANIAGGYPASYSLGFYGKTSEVELSGVAAPAGGVPLEDNGTGMFSVPAGPHVVRVVGKYNLPSSYSFVVRPVP